MSFIDLSAPISHSEPDTPEFLKTEIEYQNHQHGATGIEAILGVPPHLLRHEEGWAVETFSQFGTHSSTHVDAPWHYNSTIQGQPAQTIDQLPLEWFFQEGVVLDMTHKADGEVVTPEELAAAFTEIGYSLKPLDIVLIHTGRDAFYTQPDYMFRGCGVSVPATKWLYERGVRVMGIDAWSWDAPLDRQAAAAREANQPGIFWAAHQVDLPYCQIEQMHNLGALPPFGFKVACFPLKIVGGSAGPTRAVAIVP